MIYQGKQRYPVHEVCIHTTATAVDWMWSRPIEDKINEIRRWHTTAPFNFNDIGYHWVIDRNGSVGKGRWMNVIGAGVKGHNRGVIHIALVGGRGGSADDKFEDHYTKEQEATLRQMIREISRQTELKIITGHNQYANKACPCFRVVSDEWLYREKTPWYVTLMKWIFGYATRTRESA